MLPSLLAREIRTGLKQFLVTGFEPADAFLHGLMSRFTEDEAAWLKGPYVQLGLPFATGAAGRTFFQTFETEHPGYIHQEQAWKRLSSQHLGASTLVATGTGSGKTECFMFPLLDHCARARAAGEAGIKALVIYPMNALAGDQARRIAALVATVPALAGLRVGLYVGGNAGAPGQGMVMTPNGVITDRETLRKHPPDVLLTNYKMLDYLMMRPKDQPLWARNKPDTLRYIVVDELHTFDGAQGTDLALLLRRLRARLKMDTEKLICCGTSATLGGSSNTEPLREYARQIFGVDFPAEAVITESRLSVDAFLGDATVDHMFLWRSDIDAALEVAQYASPQAAVRAWFGVFFPDLQQPADENDVVSAAWRRELGAQLKGHQLFVNLLRLMKAGVVGYVALAEAYARNMPAATKDQLARVIDALLVLVAWARRENDQPLVTLRLQVWVRELRRMVSRLSRDPDQVRLLSERDLPGSRDGVYLPMIQCSQCRTTGWLSRLVDGSRKLSTDLDEIYNTWFGRRPEAARLYPAGSVSRPQVDGLSQFACVSCGNVQPDDKPCIACAHHEVTGVFRVTAQRTQVSGNAQFTRHDDTCPGCGERGELLLLGARSATLGAQVVEASWASVFNDDKKLIAFSDSVQDAAHRAGFFGARTWQNNVRTAWARVLDELNVSSMPWSDFLKLAEKRFETPGSVLQMPAETLVAEFLAPNMTWQRDWAEGLLKHGRLPPTSRLPERIRKRLLWQLFSDLTYQSRRGRTLERIGKATLSVPWSRVEAVAAKLLPRFHEDYGARGLELNVLTQWLWGTLTHMRQRGGVLHPEMTTYAADGNVWGFLRSAGRGEWLPKMGEFTPRPTLLTLGKHGSFDRLSGTTRPTWYDRWAGAALGRQMLMAPGLAADLYRLAFRELVADGVLISNNTHHLGETIALSPEALEVATDVAFAASDGGQRRLALPAKDAAHMLKAPCLDAVDASYVSVIPDAADWWAERFSRGDLRRVIAAEHTGLLDREQREELEQRFKDKNPRPWYANLLSATPTLEMGVDIGDLSSVLLCSVPPNQASFLQRVGRAGRRDGNAMATTLADGNSPHDLYFFAEPEEMMAGEVAPPGVFLRAAEVLRRQMFAFCMDDWVSSLGNPALLPEKTSPVLDAVDQARQDRFPYLFCDHVLKHEQRLFDAFMVLLGEDADDIVRGRLWDFMQGQGDADGLRSRLLKALQELVEERRSYKARKDELEKAKAKAKQKPQDEATQKEIEGLDRERDKMLELIAEINRRDLLGTLTDAGLIPNYAFPEAGIQLKSVLWRRRASDEPGTGAYVTLEAQKFERPAQSALSEFAPENRFYANQRRVEVDQVNMSLAKTEEWRFCPSCHHMQNLEIEKDLHQVCPRCADPMWSDGGQRRTLLRFRQAIANSNDPEVRIDDSTEDREPKYYVRQLMADFLPGNIREAWQIPSGGTPFGFEFISSVAFRDVNFGELARPGDQFKVAGRDAERPGFRLCRHCGKVQKSPRSGANPSDQSHSFDCPKYGNNDPANLLECLYLYREFESEALRILVPYTKHGVDEQVIQSFMAAVQLGLKRRFGGKVDHIRMMLQDEPGKDGGPRKHYVLLYDSVPGGTGYLHQLLTDNAQTLRDVLRLALNALTTCSCNHDPEKDGCYRCLYQYRLGRQMALVSRERAKSVLCELVEALDALIPVKTISDIYINPNFDSVLEARFIESLRKLSGVDGLPPIKLVQDIVNGKAGYVLEIAGQRYRIEPQVEVGDHDGVAVPSKPDFVFWPWAAGAQRKAIAVFCDGWSYHKDSLQQDAHKRSAILASGRLWVWAVTHQDVAAALAGNLKTDLESPLVVMTRHDGTTAAATAPRPQEKAFVQNAITRLVHFLALGAGDQHLHVMQRDAAGLGLRLIPSTPADRIACNAERAHLLPRLPSEIRDPGTGYAPMMSRPSGPASAIGNWPLLLMNGIPASKPWRAPTAVVLDESAADDEDALHAAWRRWLQLSNAMQFLPGMLPVTVSGLDAGDYDYVAAQAYGATTPSPPDRRAPDASWQKVIEQALPAFGKGLRALAAAGALPPEVGVELADDKGRVIADAELGWTAQKVAVLRSDQVDLLGVWQEAGWNAIASNAANATDDHLQWASATATALGLTLHDDEECHRDPQA